MIRDPARHEALLAATRRFVRETAIPNETLVEERDEIPEAIVDEMRRLGMFGWSIPERYGGAMGEHNAEVYGDRLGLSAAEQRRRRDAGVIREEISMRRTLCAMLLTLIAGAAAAQGYPSKPVRLVVPYPAGGIVEIIARAVVDKVAANWNNPVIVEAKPGANGSIGTDTVAKSAPDGYTWLLATLSHTTNPSLQKDVPWHPTGDFAGAAVLATVPALAVVPASLSATSLLEFVALAKIHPGKFNYLMPGTGTSMHLNSELLKLSAGIDVVAVPYKGLPPAVPDLLSGALSFGLLSAPLAAPHVKAGKLRALAIASPTRSAQFPDVPTFAEAGFPDAQVVSWFAILLPAKTPGAIVARVNQELDKALRDPEVVRRLENAGANVAAPGKPEEVDAMLKKEVARWAKFVKDAKIEAQ